MGEAHPLPGRIRKAMRRLLGRDKDQMENATQVLPKEEEK